MFPAPSPLPTALGVLCMSLSVLFLSLSSLSISCPGMAGGVSNFQGIAHTGECEGSSSVPVAPPKREARIYESVPAGSLPKYHLISFRCSLVLLFVPVSAVHDFRRSSHPHAHARHLGFAHARA